MEHPSFFDKLVTDLTTTDTTIVLLLILLVVAVIILDAMSSEAHSTRTKAGLGSADSSQPHDNRLVKTEAIEAREYISEIQGLTGRPDAILIEDGIKIPVCRKPLTKKIRDRHIAQLLVYLRLLEEFEGKRPPHGYLIIGSNNRRVKILNSSKRQDWLTGILADMQAIMEGRATAKATPDSQKCSNCSARHACNHSLADSLVQAPQKNRKKQTIALEGGKQNLDSQK
jgi:CRISPR/Cas system-associated exonuclease Cas4 (RecB family)